MRHKLFGLMLVIILLLLLACSNLQFNTPTTVLSPSGSPTTSGSESTEKPSSSTSTPIIRLSRNGVFCPSENEDAQKSYNDANILKENGKFAEAEELYLKAIELDPNYCDAMDNLGQLLRQQNRISEAIDWYKKSLEIMPDNTVALQNLALAYDLDGKTEKAIEEYEKLVEVAPENPEGYFGLGNIYVRLEQPEKAIEYLEMAEKIYAQDGSPYLADAQYYLGLSHFMLQNCVDARKYLEPIYAQFSEDGGINYVLGVCYLSTEPPDVNAARDYILKAQELGIQIPADVLSAINDN